MGWSRDFPQLFRWRHGDDLAFRLTIDRGPTGAPVTSLAGWRVAFEVRQSPDDAAPLAAKTTADGTVTTVGQYALFAYSETETAALPAAQELYFKAICTDPAGNTFTPEAGRLYFVP